MENKNLKFTSSLIFRAPVEVIKNRQKRNARLRALTLVTKVQVSSNPVWFNPGNKNNWTVQAVSLIVVDPVHFTCMCTYLAFLCLLVLLLYYPLS